MLSDGAARGGPAAAAEAAAPVCDATASAVTSDALKSPAAGSTALLVSATGAVQLTRRGASPAGAASGKPAVSRSHL